MRSHPFPYLHIKVSKIALGDADIVPINPVGMREVHAGNADIAVFDGSASPYAVRPALGSYGLFTNNVLGRLVLSDTLKRCLSNAVAMCPTAETDFGCTHTGFRAPCSSAGTASNGAFAISRDLSLR